jgi:N-acetylglucosaminyl-diphospho-decaprenol L-rhamnosyltransferase
MRSPLITVSIVSHRQNALVNQFLSDLDKYGGDIAVVVTENVPDATALQTADHTFPMAVVRNTRIKGYGANHNYAFAQCQGPFFCVCNPDLRLIDHPFPRLIRTLEAEQNAVVGPLVVAPGGRPEDSARRFPTLLRLASRVLRGPAGPDYATDGGEQQVEWVAGMFMLFRASDYRAIGGFDEGYFLYYEDVDICRRLALRGRKVIYNPEVAVVHDARRGSRRNLRLAGYHAASMLRFFMSRQA